MPKKLDWIDWLYGLVGGFVGGGSSGVVASLVAMGITPQSYNLGIQLGATLKLFFSCFVINGIISMFLWLKQKPLPSFVETETVTITKTKQTEPGKETNEQKTTVESSSTGRPDDSTNK